MVRFVSLRNLIFLCNKGSEVLIGTFTSGFQIVLLLFCKYPDTLSTQVNLRRTTSTEAAAEGGDMQLEAV